MPKLPKGVEPKIIIQVRLATELVARIDRYARASGLSRSAAIHLALTQAEWKERRR
jgi:predicted transcriptional regulator